MYTSILTTLLLLTSTSLAVKLPLGPGHFPIIPAQYDSNFAYPAAKRQEEDSDASLLSGLNDLLAPLETASETVPLVTTTMVTVTATLSTSLSAWPSSTGPAALPQEELASVYVCDDIDWNGPCSHHFTKPGGADVDCAQLSGRESSVGPDPGFLCEFFTNSYCRKFADDGSDFIGLSWPGSRDLRSTEKGDLNDRLFSYVCFKVL